MGGKYSEFGGEEDRRSFSGAGEPFPEKLLVVHVDVGRVPEC
jgi:hypothetical protein